MYLTLSITINYKNKPYVMHLRGFTMINLYLTIKWICLGPAKEDMIIYLNVLFSQTSWPY